MNQIDRFRGCLLGLAAGDAVGTSVEFRPRGTFPPLTDMVGGGTFGLLPGQWTDDTSMALCLATSLVERDGFDAQDQMDRYRRWRTDGYLSSNGVCFDIGSTVSSALDRYRRHGNPYAGSTDPQTAGNGCIMRLAPVPMFYYPDIDAAERYAAESSRTTHGAQECIDACRLFSRMMVRALLGRPKDEVLLGDAASFAAGERILAMARGTYRDKAEGAIRGSGYVVHSLEAALWVFSRTDRFADAVLMAANLGDDADTTAAVCGQLAGAFYGESAIPSHWLDRLALRREITRLADRLAERSDRLAERSDATDPAAAGSPESFPYVTRLDVLYPALTVVDLGALADACTDRWFNQTLCRVNDSVVRLGVFLGEYHWHKHDHLDEFFHVVDGRLLIDLREDHSPAAAGLPGTRTVELAPRQGFVVPRGVIHRTRALERTVVLMVEGQEIVPTGDPG